MTSAPYSTISNLRVRPGEVIRAEDWNRLIDVLESVILGNGLSSGSRSTAGLTFANLLEDVTKYSHDTTFETLAFDSTVTAPSDPWVSFSDERQYASDGQGGIYLEGERVALLHTSGGRLIPIPGARFHLVVFDEDLEPDSSATCSIWRRKADDTGWEDTGINEEVFDWMLGGAEAITTGSRGVIMQVSHEPRIWIVIAVQCEA